MNSVGKVLPLKSSDLVYTARDPLVTGIGFVSAHDIVSFPRRQSSAVNPLCHRLGRSQSGRYTKDLV